MQIRTIISSVSTATLLVAGLAGGVATADAASNVYVSTKHCSDAGQGTQQTPYCTVQKAVTNVEPGGTVSIDSGIYTGQVVIGNGRDNITLKGNGHSTVLKAPATLTATKAIVQVSKATGVTIKNLEVAGPGSSGCDSLEYGIRIDTNGQANIVNDHITAIRDNPLSGCQNGVGIQVGRSADNTKGSATITNTKIDNYQKNGITVSGNGSSADIRANTIIGAGPTAVIAQNGIEVANGATASLAQNTVKNNSYSPQTVSSTGILILSAKNNITANQNTLNGNDVGLYVSDTKNSTFSQNTANNSVFNGIYADVTAKNNAFTQNSAHGTSGSNDPAYPSYDIEDDSTGNGTLGTANTWHQNGCKTSLPAELCRQ